MNSVIRNFDLAVLGRKKVDGIKRNMLILSQLYKDIYLLDASAIC
ncbi:MAG: hypothetical protein ACOYIF_11630 [Acetivibrionales bacterium]|jgi:hypothetical protein